MAVEPEILELLVRWEEGRRHGEEITPEELCPDDAALRERLRQRIARRLRLEGVLDLPTEGQGAAAPPPAGMPRIPGYELLEVLGRGGAGIVYRARQLSLDRLVAIKMILTEHLSPQQRSRFQAEAEAVAGLHHPGIVQIHEVGEAGGAPYLVLELLEGGSLSEQLEAPLPPTRAAGLLALVARAAHHAHERGIVHRDLKPANVLFGADGAPRITDFGLAKRLEALSPQGSSRHGPGREVLTQTQTGAILGTPSYMAPEQASGLAHELGPATDVYALGVILYEVLTGRPPFLGDSILDTLEQIRGHDPVPPRRLQPRVPADLDIICLKCLEKDAARRYPSAAALAEDLERFLQGEPILARSLTFFDQLARVVSQSHIDVRFRVWGTFCLAAAPLPFLSQLGVFLLYRDRPWYGWLAVAVTLATLLGFLLPLLVGIRRHVHLLPTLQRHQVLAVWGSHLLGVVLVPVACWQMSTPGHLFDPLLLYPLWLIHAGGSFLSLAPRLGVLYLLGGGCFLASLLLPLAPLWMPLATGLMMSMNMLVQGIFLRRLARAGASAGG